MTDGAYKASGYDADSLVGYGERAAILVVDLQTAFTDPQFPMGGNKGIHDAVEATARLLKVARAAGLPVASCYTAYHSLRDMPYWKIAPVREQFLYGHPCTDIDPRILDADHDYVFCKSGPSIFFQTPVTTFLAKNRIDTVIVTGCTTSGCVRASIIDAFSHGYRTIVPQDCSGDVYPGPHRDNLRDVSRRYADVTHSDDVIEWILNRPMPNA